MYLSRLNLWNFRKYGYSEIDKEPSLSVKFKQGLNLIVGENDSGKTTIVDAIKIVLGTQSYDAIRIDETDFFKDRLKGRAEWFKIECIFEDLNDFEAGRFLEWIEITDDNNVILAIRVIAKVSDNKIIIKKTAGKEGVDIGFEASEHLRVTYLKPLRDAENELSPGYKSRFAQVLKSHPIFKKSSEGEEHPLETLMKKANEEIERYFSLEQKLINGDQNKISTGSSDNLGSTIIETLSDTLKVFQGIDNDRYKVRVNISNMELNKILSRLMLLLDENKVGLGTLNQLYIAMELLLLEVKNINKEFGLALIEEVEAHLHPQAQLRIIKYLNEEEIAQTILTTHSITLASIVNLESLIICREGKAFSLNRDNTNLSIGDYEFLERFLDSTKANLFFAKGLIFVEGDAENLLLPTIAEIIKRPLTKYGVSIVNVGNIAFLRYVNIFVEKNKKSTVGLPISIVTDLDVRPIIYYNNAGETPKYEMYKVKDLNEETHHKFSKMKEAEGFLRIMLGKTRLEKAVKESYIEIIDDYEAYKDVKRIEKSQKYDLEKIKVFTNNWTMEFDLALSCIREYLYAAILIAKDINEDEVAIESISMYKYLLSAKRSINKWETDKYSNYEIAYLIYEPLLKGQASKAVCAQYLARILSGLINNGRHQDIIESILEDKYMKYILDSIYHVTEDKVGSDT
ncbi:AAA family ATPase [Clostridium kluyveri]|uniref:AAA family ATPase n=1 Tax=Clostridium kluyveri TaxID=1534 RepID=UPI002246683D|nr:AAA family ATPase [Clostridium kluyveri]UZQ48823.1 AAA family ATPase [Clostridium kluyveri]